MRACDVTFYKGTIRLANTSKIRPDRYTINIKQAKADPDRIGAMPTVGATGTPIATCLVAAMWSYFQHTKPAPEGPLFVDTAAAPLPIRPEGAPNAHRIGRTPVRTPQLPSGRRPGAGTRRQERLLHDGARQVEDNRERFKICGTTIRHTML
jgi:hypothetical protein